jgi:FkbM family methyltransferase
MDLDLLRPQSLELQLEDLISEDPNSVLQREQSTFDRLVEPYGKRLVLFGAGNLGRKTNRGLRRVGIEPLAFTDNNKQLWNTRVDDLLVLPPEEAARRYGRDAAFVTTIWSTTGEDRQANRCKQLSDLGCQKILPFGILFWKYPDIFLPHASLDSPHKLLEHANELRQVFNSWADEDSRREFIAQLKFRLRMDFDGLSSPVNHAQYFPDDLYSIIPGEVFIDCGAFDGDTIHELLLRQNKIAKILAFEPDPLNYDRLKQNITTLPASIQAKIEIQRAVVGGCGQKVRFSSSGTISSRVEENGDLEFDCVCLDQTAINLQPTFIKMDIEGSEIDALSGGARVIGKSLPILAICVYHLPDHFWKIPMIIKSLSEDYQLFLRPHEAEGWELVCYAVPGHRLLPINPEE